MRVRLLFVLLALVVATGCSAVAVTAAPGSAGRPVPAGGAGLSTPGGFVGSVSTARQELAGLHVAAPHSMTGYSRARFDVWARRPDHCTTRQEVLKATGRRVVMRPGSCQPTSGSWFSAYDEATVTRVALATIDHVVPLAEAWRSGADGWSPARRRAFGNDLADPQLVVASESSNSAKGDSGPADWRPGNRAVWCSYAEDYIRVKFRFGLTTSVPERSALADMLGSCR